MLGYISVPQGMVQVGTLLSTVVFVSAPIFALYYAAKYQWTVKRALIFFFVGLALYFGVGFLATHLPKGAVLASSTCAAVAVQCGFPLWCVSLGALLANLLKDKNLLIPVSIFLVAFDFFLTQSSFGPTNQLIKHTNVLPSIGYAVPAMTSGPAQGKVATFAYIGPADFLFMGMFFVALYRFKMRYRETVYWLIPAILIYLLLALKIPILPLLVPIGLCVLIVNWREFKLNREEKISTLGVVLIVVALIAVGMLTRGMRVGPSKRGVVPTIQERANSPGTVSPGPTH